MRPRALLRRHAALGDVEAPGPRPLPPPGPLVRWARPLLLPVSSVIRTAAAEPVLSLTYDDGPHPRQTPELLDVLAEHGARVTFFVLTDRAREHPRLVGRLLAAGHEVAVHGTDHARLADLPAADAVRRLRRARDVLQDVAGRPVHLYRPTYGALTVTTALAAGVLGLTPVLWSAWGLDWVDAPAQDVVGRVVGALHPGAIVLLHETTDDQETLGSGTAPRFSRADVARGVLAGMRAQGYASVPVGELLERYPAVRAVSLARWAGPVRRAGRVRPS